MKMKMKMKNRSHRHETDGGLDMGTNKVNKKSVSVSSSMLICIKQHLKFNSSKK